MASFCENTKISGALKILSVETISDDNYRRIPPLSNFRKKPWSYEREKQMYTDAVHYCMVLLRQSNRLTNFRSDVLSVEATLTGYEMFERICNVQTIFDNDQESEVPVSTSAAPARVTAEKAYSANKNRVPIKEEVIDVSENFYGDPYIMPLNYLFQQEESSVETETHGDIMCENSQRNSCDLGSNESARRPTMVPDSASENNLPPSPLSLTENYESQSSAITRNPRSVTRKNNHHISLNIKKKVVELVQKHPHWTLKQLQENGCDKLNSLSQISHWTRHVMEGGTQMEKFVEINSRTYERLARAQSNGQTVTVENLRQWAIAISRDLYGSKFNFNATKGWVHNFKKLYNIRGPLSGNLVIPDKKMPRKSRNLRESSRRRTTNY